MPRKPWLFRIIAVVSSGTQASAITQEVAHSLMRLHGRWSLGLPASTIDLGNVDEIGYVSRNREFQAGFIARGFQRLPESQVLET